MKPSSYLALFVVFALVPVSGAANECKFEREFELSLDVAGSESLEVIARAGTLTITGTDRSDEVLISGRACASEEDWVEAAAIDTRGGDRARIEVNLPDVDGGWSLWGDRYAHLDLDLRVPAELHLDIRDSSGSMDLVGIGSADIKDSSGSIEIEDAAGPLSVQDSSGSISISRVRGDVTIESDSSGSIRGEDIGGSVLVKRDSSGSIRFSDVTGDFTVERDSSGEIVARDVGGDFTVLKDGSGGIHHENVDGDVSIPQR